MINYFHSYFFKRAVIYYCLALISVSLIWFDKVMPWYWLALGLFEVFGFFYFSYSLTRKHQKTEEKAFIHWAFACTVILRLLWTLAYYGITQELWHTPWEQPIGTSMDSYAYFDEAQWLREMVNAGDIRPYIKYVKAHNISDAGYPILLTIVSMITGKSILLTRVPNAFFDAITVVLIYKIGKRMSNEKVAKMASIFTMLMPMMFFYSGVTMKESIMVMLTTLAVERGSFMCFHRHIKLIPLFQFLLAVASLLLFRTVLAWVLFIALILSFVFTTNRALDTRSKLVYVLIFVLFVLMIGGGFILEQIEELTSKMTSSIDSMDYRATRLGGNHLVKNLSKAVFAPIIFAVPFPTMVNIDYQQIQMLQNGGYFIKNILSFFCILAIIMLLKNGKWRISVMPLAVLVGYLIVLCFSSFAHSGRFHLPIIPIELLLSAYAISNIEKKHLLFFNIVGISSIFICILWNWFKLKGKGMI